MLAKILFALTRVRDPLALVGEPLAPVSQTVALVGLGFPVSGVRPILTRGRARAGGSRPAASRSFALAGGLLA